MHLNDMFTADMYLASLQRISQPMFSGPNWAHNAAMRIHALPNIAKHGTEPASDLTVARALAGIEMLKEQNLIPSKIIADTEGGICFVFSRRGVYVGLTFFNDGEFLGEARVNGEWLDLVEGDYTEDVFRLGVERAREYL